MKLWAFGTSTDGLGLSELAFWLLTDPEFTALRRVWESARGIKPPLTKEERENLARNHNFMLRAEIHKHNTQVEELRKKAERSGIKLVEAKRG